MIRTLALCALAGAILAALSVLAFDTAVPGYIAAAIAAVIITRRRTEA